MPAERATSAVRRRNAIGFATSAILHALLFGLGALMLTRHSGRSAAAERVEVTLVEAKPNPIRDVPPVHVPPGPPDRQPTPAAKPVVFPRHVTRTHREPRAHAPPPVPAVELSPSTEPVTADAVAVPATEESAPRWKEEAADPSPTKATPVPATPRPITILASPRYRSNPRPEYPIIARRRHEEGEVRVAVTVSPGGRPLRISLSKSSGFPLLDHAAMDAVRTWTFEPARASGVVVTSEVVVPVRFSLAQE